MTDKEIIQISKFLSLVLRHKPETIGLTLDDNGWADSKELIEKINKSGTQINDELLNLVVETNSKKRFSFNEDKTKIRANQGHSIEVDLELEPKSPPDILYHGTASQNVVSILQNGIEKRSRQHVHLSLDKETAINVGSRHGKPTILVLNAKQMSLDGYKFYLSENKVWLTEHVPAKYLSRLKE